MMSRRILQYVIGLLFFVIIYPLYSRGQSVERSRYSRYHFAEMYLGLDVLGIPSSGQAYYANEWPNDIRSSPVNPSIIPRLSVGGTHFWGHADFFVNFPTLTIRRSNGEGPETWYRPGVETGASIYPWAIHEDRLRPHAGISWASISYQQTVEDDGKGPALNLSRISLQAGISWWNTAGLWDVGISYLSNHLFRYPLSRTRFKTISLPRWSLKFSYKYLFDTTDKYEQEATGGQIPPRIRRFREEGKLNTFSVALGFSGAFTLSSSSHNRSRYPFLDDPAGATAFPGISVGYYLFSPDASLRLSWRSIHQNQEAFDLNQKLHRRSFALDFLKFIGDYQGFVPFVGPFISREYLHATEFDGNRRVLNRSRETWAAGIVFGWDIRPIRTPGLILRTNLRYTPRLSIATGHDQRIRFNQLEVNFIQLVVYPERLFN